MRGAGEDDGEGRGETAADPKPGRRTSGERAIASFLPYDSSELDAAAADTSVVAWHTLTRSAAHVFRDWEHGPASEQRGADVHGPLDTLCAAIRDGADGKEPSVSDLHPAYVDTLARVTIYEAGVRVAAR